MSSLGNYTNFGKNCIEHFVLVNFCKNNITHKMNYWWIYFFHFARLINYSHFGCWTGCKTLTLKWKRNMLVCKTCSFLNSKWTFVALNLPYTNMTLRHNKTKNSQPISVSRDRKEVKNHREHKGMIKTKVGILWCTGRFEGAFWKRVWREMDKSHPEEHFKQYEHQSITFTKLFDRYE